MWMTDFIREIQRQFIEVYDYPRNPENPTLPVGVKDGTYPMTIEGKQHVITVRNDRISIDEGQ